jgi:hypothetical protein
VLCVSHYTVVYRGDDQDGRLRIVGAAEVATYGAAPLPCRPSVHLAQDDTPSGLLREEVVHRECLAAWYLGC